jgi:hypothetical protein
MEKKVAEAAGDGVVVAEVVEEVAKKNKKTS